MKQDPTKVVDASGDHKTDWDKEVANGHLIRPVQRATPGEIHVQGRPLSAKEISDRVISREDADYLARTGRRRPKATGKGFFFSNWDGGKK